MDKVKRAGSGARKRMSGKAKSRGRNDESGSESPAGEEVRGRERSRVYR